MNPFRTWKHPIAVLEQMVGLAALGALWYWWLGIAESNISRSLMSLAAVFAMLAVLAATIARGRKRLSEPEAPGSAGQTLTALLLLAMSIAAAYFLIWWVPGIAGLRGQIVSVVLRFGLAFLLVVTFWANLLGSWGRPPVPAQQSN